jgi:SulP family sulfate permease
MHDVDDHPDATTLPGLIIYRYDAPLFFANINDLRRRALVAVDRENELDPDNRVRWFLLNVEANVEIDFTAVDGLRSLFLDLRQRGARLGLVRLKEDLRLPLARTDLLELIGEDMLFATLPTAENAYLDWVERNA